jgi:hypothetical protein
MSIKSFFNQSIVCEKIGDEPGARAKRRREIKKMS